MGASLPLLSRAVATTVESLASRIALLYGLNTVGAGLGALVGGWLILGMLGFEASLRVAAALELLAAALALTLIPAMRRTADPAAAPPSERQVAIPEGVGSVALWCALAFASGFVIVALEIVWVRVIGQFGQYHAYMFATLLGVFLLADGRGIAVGGWLVKRSPDPRPGFFLAQGSGFLLALLLLLGLWWVVPHMPSGTDPTWPDTTRLTDDRLLYGIGVTVLLIGPPAFLIGLTFPFIQRAVQHDLAQVGARVGWVQLANIMGNAAGSLGTGLLALHLLGTAGTLVLLALVTIGLLLLWLLRGGRSSRAGWAMLAAVVAALALVPGNDAWWRRLHVESPGQPLAWAEDRSGVAFFRDDTGLPARIRTQPWLTGASPFFIQGFSQGTIPFLPVHMLLGAVGPLVHPAPHTVLVIGVGSGGTPWAATVNPASRQIRAVELVAPVLTVLGQIAERQPGGAIQRLLSDPPHHPGIWRRTPGAGELRPALRRDRGRCDPAQGVAIGKPVFGGVPHPGARTPGPRRNLCPVGANAARRGDLRGRLPARGDAEPRLDHDRFARPDTVRSRCPAGAPGLTGGGGPSRPRPRRLLRLGGADARHHAPLAPRRPARHCPADRPLPARRILPQSQVARRFRPLIQPARRSAARPGSSPATPRSTDPGSLPRHCPTAIGPGPARRHRQAG